MKQDNIEECSRNSDTRFKAQCYSDADLRRPPEHTDPWSCAEDRFLTASIYPASYELVLIDSQ